MPKEIAKHKLLILTSGGDSPGMNAVIRAAVRTSIYYGLEVFACHNGFQGLVDEDIFPMDAGSVTNCIQRGGTILRTSRCQSFFDAKVREKCRAFLATNNIDFLITIGGDGTFRGASLLENEHGPKIIGVPGSIDNDIIGTDYTIGYDTARNTALNAVDKIRDTASSHSRYFLIETMGRSSGFLAADVAIAGGAEYLIVPEFPMPIEKLATQINIPKRKKKSLLIIVAEADQPGRSVAMAEQLRKLTPYEYRVCILGHTQRGGTPSTLDRLVGSFMGNMAVEALLNGKSHAMTSMKNGKYTLVPFSNYDRPSRRLTDDHIIRIGNILSI